MPRCKTGNAYINVCLQRRLNQRTEYVHGMATKTNTRKEVFISPIVIDVQQAIL